jgi:hypothetical protein
MHLILASARLATVALLIGLAGSQAAKAERPANRREFAAVLATIEAGTPKETLVRLLGKPDDVRTENDLARSGVHWTNVNEFWCWGTNGHLSFPTLGRIAIDGQGNTAYVCKCNESAVPPDPHLIDEDELRRLLRLIDRLPSPNLSNYNPLRMIQIVNTLQPLGKKKALAAITEYLRVADYDDNAVHGIFLLLRVLFDVPEDRGFMPEMSLGGQQYLVPPPDRKAMPRFPIFVQDDIPFLLAGYGATEGYIAPPCDDVDYFQRVGKIRSGPLTPPDNPIASFDRAVKSTKSIFTKKATNDFNMPRTVIMNQLLWLLDSVYRKEFDLNDWRNVSMLDATEKEIREIMSDLSRLEIRWDRERNCYVGGDGSRFPEAQQQVGQPEFWPDTRSL